MATTNHQRIVGIFLIILFLGTMSVRDRRDLWNRKCPYFNHWVASTMDCGRFEDILHCLHWVDAAALTEQEKRLRNQDDPFWAVEGFLAHFCTKFQLHYKPGQDIDVDEQGIPSKCYHSAI
jgi:hypothetical protein